jgi:DNA-binding NarL/FixJ family response regulator
VLLVLAGRPGAMLDDLVGRALGGVRPRILRLGPLSDAGVRRLVRQDLAEDADDEFCRACARASGGNPFLLSEALLSLRAAGIRPVAAEAGRVANVRPETVARAVLSRIARLGPEAVRFARALAVLSPAAELRHVARLAELPVSTAARLADALARDAVVTPNRPPEFVHPLMRTAVYTDSSEVLRAADHKRAARVLADDGAPAEQIARHLLAAEPDADPWVVGTLRAAASGALGRGAPEPAAAYLSRAVAEPPPVADRGPLYAELGRVLGMANRPEGAAAALQRAVDLIETPFDRMRLLVDLGTLMLHTGRREQSRRALDRASAIADRHPDLPSVLHGAFALADMAALKPASAWLARLDRIAPTLDPAREDDRLALSIIAFGGAATGDRPAGEVARLAMLATAGPLPSHDQWFLANMASGALSIADRGPEALDVLDRGLAETRRLGAAPEFRYLSLLRSHTAYYCGRLSEAEADARAALEIEAETNPEHLPLAAAMLIDALVQRGEIDEATRVLTSTGMEGDHPFDTPIAHFVLMARGRLRMAQHRPQEGLADFLAAGGPLAANGFRNPRFAEWRAEAALAHLALGEADRAEALAAQNLDLARAFEAASAVSVVLWVCGLVTGGAEGLALLAEAAAVPAGRHVDLEHAHALVDYGAALRRAGRRKPAPDVLRQGLDLASRCGAEALVARATSELHAAGARPRRAQLTGPEALTVSELRIARLAVDGATNREIAQTLFLSRRTVELHLTNAYRKLGISTRAELPATLSGKDEQAG